MRSPLKTACAVMSLSSSLICVARASSPAITQRGWTTYMNDLVAGKLSVDDFAACARHEFLGRLLHAQPDRDPHRPQMLPLLHGQWRGYTISLLDHGQHMDDFNPNGCSRRRSRRTRPGSPLRGSPVTSMREKSRTATSRSHRVFWERFQDAMGKK